MGKIIRVWNACKGKTFLYSPHRLRGPSNILHEYVPGFMPGRTQNQCRCKFNHSLQSSGQIRKQWSCTSTPPPDMTLWCRQGKKNCTFTWGRLFGSGVHLTFYLSRYQGSCPDEHKNSVGVNLTTHFDLAPKFGISGAVRLLPTPPHPPTWLRGAGKGKKTVPLPEAYFFFFVAVRIRVRTQQLCHGQVQNNCYRAADSNG